MLEILGAVVIAALLLASAVFRLVVVEGVSMLPSYEPGDRLLVVRPWAAGGPRRFDVVVFDSPENPEALVLKRVVGLPGEEIIVRGRKLRVNGTAVGQPFETLGPEIKRDWERIPAGHYVVLGDNRARSIDSRQWGLLPCSTFEGIVAFKVWSSGRNVR